MGFDPCSLCGSVPCSALIKQTHQSISVLSHRLLGVHSSAALITPGLDSGKSLSHALQMVLSLPRAQGWLENHLIPTGVLWGGICVPLLHLLTASAGGILHSQHQAPQTCRTLYENQIHI